MNDTKPRKKKRTQAEIAAEKEAWLLKHRWGGVLKALRTIEDVRETLAQAEDDASACPTLIDSSWTTADMALAALAKKLTEALPSGLAPD